MKTEKPYLEMSDSVQDRNDWIVSDVNDVITDAYYEWFEGGGREHLDINQYKDPFERALTKHKVTITRMNKSPFGFNFTVEGDDRAYRLFYTAKAFGVERLT